MNSESVNAYQVLKYTSIHVNTTATTVILLLDCVGGVMCAQNMSHYMLRTADKTNDFPFVPSANLI